MLTYKHKQAFGQADKQTHKNKQTNKQSNKQTDKERLFDPPKIVVISYVVMELAILEASVGFLDKKHAYWHALCNF